MCACLYGLTEEVVEIVEVVRSGAVFVVVEGNIIREVVMSSLVVVEVIIVWGVAVSVLALVISSLTVGVGTVFCSSLSMK